MDEDETECQACGGKGLIACLHIGTGRDEDGWCTTCDAPAEAPGLVTCECQD